MTSLPNDDELFDLVAKEALVERSRLSRDAALKDLGIASLDVISILFEVEDRFGIVVDEISLVDCATLGQLVDRLKAEAVSAA
jgi:acyl carrier protein